MSEDLYKVRSSEQDSLKGSINSFMTRTIRNKVSSRKSPYSSDVSYSYQNSEARMGPELHEVLKAYDEQIHLQKTLIHICCEIGAVNTAKLIIERIIEGVIKYKDALDDCLSREGVPTDCTRVEALAEYLNRKDSYGIAPIHLASHSGNIQMIKLLCANECDPYGKTDDGLTVIHSAAEGDSVNSIYFFYKQYGMDVDVIDEKNCTALHWAVIEGHEVAATFLLAWGANINSQDALGNTPLHLSVCYAEKELNSRLTKILLLRGADRNLGNNDGKRAIDVISDSEIRSEIHR